MAVAVTPVDSFETYPGGQPGVSELSGVIALGDYVVGVNGLDLTQLKSFSEAMEAVQKATWPKTLHFMRDKEVSIIASLPVTIN